MGKSKTAVFLQKAQGALKARLGAGWDAETGRDHRLLKQYPWGYGGVGPAMTYKGLPTCHVFLNYGIQHSRLEPVLRRIDEASGQQYIDTYHAHHDTQNRPLAGADRTAYVADYNAPELGPVVESLLGSQGEAELLRLFDRYGDLKTLRGSLESADRVFFNLGCEEKVVAIDVVLGDLEHLRAYYASRTLTPDRRLVSEAMKALGVAL